MRGSHEGSFEVAHALAWRGEKPAQYQQLDEHYDLVVVGAGMSGLPKALACYSSPQVLYLIEQMHSPTLLSPQGPPHRAIHLQDGEIIHCARGLRYSGHHHPRHYWLLRAVVLLPFPRQQAKLNSPVNMARGSTQLARQSTEA